MASNNKNTASKLWKGVKVKTTVLKMTNKLRKGKRDGGTPEKPSTPNASQGEVLEEETTAHVIINDEILALQIKPEQLAQVREPRPPEERKKSPQSHSIVVRKLKPASEWDKPKPKTVTVAKPAPPDAQLKPIDYSEGAGLRIDEEGDIVPHSILGTVEDYKKMAHQQGEMMQEQSRPDSQAGHLSVKYEKKRSATKSYPKFQSVTESNALQNWQEKMLERKKQQGYLSKLLNKPEDHLVMNQADSYRKTQEKRYLIDRTIAFMDYGKGYRIGSEFWKQQEQIGDDITGLHMTLGQTEKGYPPPIEHVDVPDAIKKEKSTDCDRPRSALNKPWHRNPYLASRTSELKPIMQELDPHNPQVSQLQIIGRNRPWSGRRPWTGSSQRELTAADSHVGSHMGSHVGSAMSQKDSRENQLQEQQSYDPLASHPDVYPEPVFGPSLKFAGESAQWTGDSTTFTGQVGIEARVTFESFAGKRTTSFLEISNDGTTSIYYDWRKVPKVNPFDMANPKTQRFYFNTSNGVILPGDKMKFPFVFKSPNAGVFSEQWQFETSPVVCGGAALVVTLRGVALQEDKYKKQRTKLEDSLAKKQTEQIVSGILDDILEGIQSPDRPCSPVDAHITQEEIFRRINKNLYYHNETVSRLHKCYLETFPEEERENAPEWDLSVENLRTRLLAQECEDEESMERKQNQLDFVNHCLLSLCFPPFSPKQQQMYNAGYSVMCSLVDRLVGTAMEIRHFLGMPERDEGGIPDDQSDGKKGAAKGGGKPDPKKGGKDPKSGGKGGKESKTSGGKAASGKRPATRDKPDRAGSPVSGQQSPVPATSDPLVLAKYKEKLYAQAYNVIGDALTDIAIVFDGVEQQEGGPKPPTL